MSDSDPLLLRRLIELRRFPLLAGAELSELAALAENVVESSYASGALVAPPGRLDAVHLILSGQIDAGPDPVGAREVLGWLDALAGRPLAAPAVAVGETRTLRLAASDLGDLLEDNFGLLAVALRDLAARTLAARPAGPLSHRTGGAPAGPAPSPLGLVERMIVLREGIPFVSARLEALATLAYQAQETGWPAGEVVSRSGDPVRTAHVILEGALRATHPDRAPALLGPGGTIGILESLAGLRHTATHTVVTPARALELPSTAIFNVLEDHPELGLAMLETLAGGLLDATATAEARAS